MQEAAHKLVALHAAYRVDENDSDQASFIEQSLNTLLQRIAEQPHVRQLLARIVRSLGQQILDIECLCKSPKTRLRKLVSLGISIE